MVQFFLPWDLKYICFLAKRLVKRIGVTPSYNFQYVQVCNLIGHLNLRQNIFQSLTQFETYLMLIQDVEKLFSKLYTLLRSLVITPVRYLQEWAWDLKEQLTPPEMGAVDQFC